MLPSVNELSGTGRLASGGPPVPVFPSIGRCDSVQSAIVVV